MAAQVLLLMALIPNIHTEELKRVGRIHSFTLGNTTDLCSVSRWTGVGKELLWNSSGSSFEIFPLDVSHSGQYQEQCWTQGNLTLERNSTLLVCDDHKMIVHERLYPAVGETVELKCDTEGPNVTWAYGSWGDLALIDGQTPSDHRLQLVENKSSLLVTVNKSRYFAYFCLEKNHRWCDLRSLFNVGVLPKFILRTVGESLELNCSDGSGNQTFKWTIDNLFRDNPGVNSTLKFPSLKLEHSGIYVCETGGSSETHRLHVCRKTEPAVVLFTVGENITLHCADWDEADWIHWFVRSDRTGGQVFNVEYRRLDNVYLSRRILEITNATQQDSGHYWCVLNRNMKCGVRTETLLMFREPEVDHHFIRNVLLSAVTVIMWCVFVGVILRYKKGEQHPAIVEELEMSQMSVL